MGVGKRQKRTKRAASCVLSRYIPPEVTPAILALFFSPTHPNSPRDRPLPPPAPTVPRQRVSLFSFLSVVFCPRAPPGGKEACPREKRVCAFLRVNAPPRGGYAALVFSLFLSMPHPQALSSPGRISLSSSSNPRYSFTYVRAIYRLRQRARIPIRESGEFSRKRGLLFLFARRHAPDHTRRYRLCPLP